MPFRFFALLGAAIIAVSISCGCSSSSPPATPVASFVNVQASDKSFSAQLPADWKTKSSDAGATSAIVEADQGDASILIVSDTAASFMGDASRNAVKPPVVTVHEMKLGNLDADYSSPEKGPTLEMTSALGPARYTEFTAGAGQIKGWRCTILGKQRAYFITVSCPSSDWKTLQPAFSKVIESLQAGSE